MVDIAKYFISKTTSKEDLKSKMMTKRKKEEVEDRGESKKPHKRSKGEVDERLEQAVSKLLDTTWSTALGPEVTKPYFIKLTRFITSEVKQKTIYPPVHHVFRAFTLCDLKSLKVVILGQDPYHQPDQANGLAFDVFPGTKWPPSLRNILKEVESCYGCQVPKGFSLESWSRQGVFLLNTVLTVERAKAFSHRQQGWEKFTDSVIKKISEEADKIVFLLWGRPSQQKKALIDQKKHCIIESSHPSPLGAYKTATPFIGSRCFAKANDFLEENKLPTVKWG